MDLNFNRILIISDIEGSSCCWNYQASSFKTREWSIACVEMSRDVNAVIKALFDAGVKQITVKDFHRTGYNLLPELIDSRARIISGYRRGPVPGIGDHYKSEAVMFLGMHAASGTGGFLAHTLTSRIERLEVNGKPMAEVELFSASLAPYGMRPIFFSGCPVACAQAKERIKKIDFYPIDKSIGKQRFDVDLWRSGLVNKAVKSLGNVFTEPYIPNGPFKAVITMRDGKEEARKLAQRWSFEHEGSIIFIKSPNIHNLYSSLIRLCYLTPFIEKILPIALLFYNLRGRAGLSWVRRHRM